MAKARKNIQKDHKGIVIFSTVLIIIGLVITTKTLSKYVLRQSNSQVAVATKFYFESNVLSVDGKNNYYYDWDGKNDYEIEFDVSNFEDVLRYNSQDVLYTVNIENSSNITIKCFINDIETNSGKLTKEKQTTDKIKLRIIPNSTVKDKEILNVSVISNLPYVKKLSGTLNVIVNQKNYNFNLIEENDYEKLIITTYDYSDKFKIKYDSTKLMLYTTNLQIAGDEIVLSSVKNSNYQIEFIKLTEDKIELGTDIIVETSK